MSLMRLRVQVEGGTESGFWYAVPPQINMIRELVHLLSQRLASHSNVQLFMDGFEVPNDQPIQLLRDHDLVIMKATPFNNLNNNHQDIPLLPTKMVFTAKDFHQDSDDSSAQKRRRHESSEDEESAPEAEPIQFSRAPSGQESAFDSNLTRSQKRRLKKKQRRLLGAAQNITAEILSIRKTRAEEEQDLDDGDVLVNESTVYAVRRLMDEATPKAQSFQQTPFCKNYNEMPPLLPSVAHAGDLIAYRILTLTEDCNPILSSHREALVQSVDASQKTITLQHTAYTMKMLSLQHREQEEATWRKKGLERFGAPSQESNQVVNEISWDDLVDVRLLKRK